MVVIAFSLIGVIGWVVTGQLLSLANQLPSYQQNISQKLKALNVPGGGVFERTGRVFSELNRELLDAGAAQGDPEAGPGPIPVTLQEPSASALETLNAFVSPLLAPLATAGIVIVLVIFMLIGREDLRDRFIELVGTRRMNVTTQALDDAGRRISRYLLMQFLVNVTYGVPLGFGLFFIGVPNALLWGVLATLLRFVPYLGPLLAMALPLLLAFAVDPGWGMLLMTAGLFLVLELISNNVVEPWLYGRSTGISSVAIMVAAIFWTWLWGPVGLLLSTPLTVCLAVAGRYVPQLTFLNVLLGNEPALKPEARLYQRMLAMDSQEASEVGAELLGKLPLLRVYDELVIPALSLAESDRHDGLLDDERKRFIIENTRELVSELAELDDARNHAPPSLLPPAMGPMVCLPARVESDELGGLAPRAAHTSPGPCRPAVGERGIGPPGCPHQADQRPNRRGVLGAASRRPSRGAGVQAPGGRSAGRARGRRIVEPRGRRQQAAGADSGANRRTTVHPPRRRSGVVAVGGGTRLRFDDDGATRPRQ